MPRGHTNPLLPDAPREEQTFNLQAVITHEVGHVFGLAHVPLETSVMYLRDQGSDLRKRTIGLADIAGICAIYPPDGTRSVSTVTDPSGKVQRTAGDPTPRRGFTSECRHDDAPGVQRWARTGEGGSPAVADRGDCGGGLTKTAGSRMIQGHCFSRARSEGVASLDVEVWVEASKARRTFAAGDVSCVVLQPGSATQ